MFIVALLVLALICFEIEAFRTSHLDLRASISSTGVNAVDTLGSARPNPFARALAAMKRIDPILWLLLGGIIWASLMLILCDEIFNSDGEVFQVFAALVAGFSGSFFTRLKHGSVDDSSNHNEPLPRTAAERAIPNPDADPSLSVLFAAERGLCNFARRRWPVRCR